MTDVQIMYAILAEVARMGHVSPLSVTRKYRSQLGINKPKSEVVRASARVRRVIDELEGTGVLARSGNQWYWCHDNWVEKIARGFIEERDAHEIPLFGGGGR